MTGVTGKLFFRTDYIQLNSVYLGLQDFGVIRFATCV